MHRQSITGLVYRALFPKPRQGDPPSFSAHVNRNLVPEVRVETSTFYGALDCIEAQYPGLDYTHEPHRRRLERFPWHRKLFKAFRDLKLTKSEILGLCQWEGTRSAKEKYENDIGRLIRDTTADGISADELKEPYATVYPASGVGWTEPSPNSASQIPGVRKRGGDLGSRPSEMEQDELLRSGAEAQARSEDYYNFDERLPRWLHEAAARNEIDLDGMLEAISERRPFHISPSHVVDASFNPPALSIANTAPTMNYNATLSAGDALGTGQAGMTDTQIAMVNVWNLSNELTRNVNAGNAPLVPAASTTSRTTTVPAAAAQPAGEAR